MVKKKVVPLPGWDSNQIWPPCRSTIRLHTARPMPVPGYSSRVCSRWKITKSDAIRLFRENPAQFELVITDLTMPEMSGLEVARQLRDCRADLPIILMTGNSSSLDSNTCGKPASANCLKSPSPCPRSPAFCTAI